MSVINKRREKTKEAMKDLGMLGYIIITTLILSCLSPTDVISRRARAIIYVMGLGFSKIMV
jgi:hypothetical protein